MNKQDLVTKVAETAGLSKSDATKAVDAVLEAVGAALERGDEIKLTGFGIFGVSDRKASMGRNPQTKEPMQIPPSKQVRFRPGAELKRRVNGGRDVGDED